MTLSDTTIGLIAGGVALYVALNVLGTVYYVRVNKMPSVGWSESAWDLSSVILGWLVFPLFNLSSPISYAVHTAR